MDNFRLGADLVNRKIHGLIFYLVSPLLFLLSSLGAAHAQAVDWVITVDSSVTPAPAGGLLEIPISIVNNGFGPPDPAAATTVEIIVPATTSFTSISGDITSCSPMPAAAGTTVICDVPALAANSATELNFLFGITTTTAGATDITVSMSEDDDLGPTSITKTLTLTAGADLEINIDAPASAASGETIEYTYSATNNGPNDAADAAISIPVPSGLSGLTTLDACTLADSTYTCAIDELGVDESIDFTFQGRVTAASPSTISILASAAGATPSDPNSENNIGSFDVTVTEGSDLALSKSISFTGSTLLVGDSVSFLLSPTYTGNGPTNVTITDTVPSNYEIDSILAPSPWDCSATSGNAISCEHPGSSSNGIDASLDTIEILATAISSGTATNTATVSAQSPTDPDTSNNSATDGGVTIADPFIDLRAHKSGPVPSLAVVNTPFTFETSTTNIGNADFVGSIEMVDSLPAGMEVSDYELNGWSCSPSTSTTISGPKDIICSIIYTETSPLATGDTTPSVELTTTVTGDGSTANILSISAPSSTLPDENASNDTTSYGISSDESNNSANVSIEKSVTLTSLPAGDIQTFELEIINDGPVTALDVRIEDTLTRLINNAIGNGQGLESLSFANISAADANCTPVASGSTGVQLRLRTHNQNNTVAARAIADINTFGQRSYLVETRRQSLSLPNIRSIRLRLL